MSKKWNIQGQFDPLKNIITSLLEVRGFLSEKDQMLFLDPPSLKHYLSEFPADFMQSLRDARKLILQFISDKKPIIIYGDYDADGVCATAILYDCLVSELNYPNVMYFIPNRFEHGYGISDNSLEDILKLAKDKFENPEEILFITVDTGITAVEEISTLKSLGHKVILTDHHQKPDALPKADVIFWSDQVVGSTLSWILVKALGSKSSNSLALAGIATVTDVHPLVGINRVIVKHALSLINSNPPLGIKKLIELSNKSGKEVSTYDLGWVIGPRLNASGRIFSADISLDVLLSSSSDKAILAAEKLNKLNQERQDKTFEMYGIASRTIDSEVPKVIVSSHKDYHEGIIGLVASRLVQKYNRPSIVISIEEDIAKGSVRSVPGIDIIKVLREFNELFINLGGHPMAAGFSIKTKNIPTFKESIENYFSEKISDDLLIPELKVDMQIPLQIVDLELVKSLEKMAPFGMGNPEPKFCSLNISVVGIDFMGTAKQHVSIKLYTDDKYYKAVMFNIAENDFIKNLVIGDKIDLVYKPKVNEFRGNVSVDLFVDDIRYFDAN